MSEHQSHAPSDRSGTGPTPPPDSTIPDSDTGVAAGYTGEPSSFEPEEDAGAPETATAEPEATTGEDAGGAAAGLGGTGPRSTEARGMSAEDRSIFQSHWDDFADHLEA